MGPEYTLVVRLEKPTGSLRGAFGAPEDNETPPLMHPGGAGNPESSGS